MLFHQFLDIYSLFLWEIEVQIELRRIKVKHVTQISCKSCQVLIMMLQEIEFGDFRIGKNLWEQFVGPKNLVQNDGRCLDWSEKYLVVASVVIWCIDKLIWLTNV